MDSISLPVIAPRLERLKRSGSSLHLLAGALILAHAVSRFRGETAHTLYFWCLLLISLDIILLALFAHGALHQLPRLNLLFRVIEIAFFAGIGILTLLEGHPLTGVFHLLLGIAYGFLLYCERSFRSDVVLSIHHTGITIPDLPESRFLYWTYINEVNATYDSIAITTADPKPLHFRLQHNLSFDQMVHIQTFCRFYLGA